MHEQSKVKFLDCAGAQRFFVQPFDPQKMKKVQLSWPIVILLICIFRFSRVIRIYSIDAHESNAEPMAECFAGGIHGF